MQALHGPGQQGVHLLYPHQVTLCQRLQHATHIFALRDRHFRSPGPAIVRNGLFHISRMLEIRCIDIYGRNICCLLCLGYQEIVTGTPSPSIPLTDEALQYPQARDVLQETDMSTHAAFVGKPCTAGFFGQHRLIQSDTQQRPRAGTKKSTDRLLSLAERNGMHGTGRIVRTYGHHLDSRGQADLGSNFRAQHPTNSSRLQQFAEQMFRQAQFAYQRHVPCASTRIQKFGCRCDTIFIAGYAGQIIGKQIGHEQQMTGFAQPSFILFFPGIELEHRIDGHHLYAGFGVMRRFVYTGEHFRRGVGRGSVAVTQRIPHQIAGPVHQPVVHTPRVDTDAFHIGILGRSTAQPLFHFLEQGREVPVHMSAQPYLPVGEAM